ncbi:MULTISPECIES: hypothetical protein [unclassified Streptomyces]|uniref:hypothetical protein n=1 Tax=unclassified Streptomyces TaxID=2593676 RepID=UPI0034431373
MFTHAGCGEPIDPTARCAAGGVVPQPQDVMVIPLGDPDEGARTDPVATGLREPHRLLDPLPGASAQPGNQLMGG